MWLAGRFALIAGPALLTELTGDLSAPGFRRRLAVEGARAFVCALRSTATLIDRALGSAGETDRHE